MIKKAIKIFSILLIITNPFLTTNILAQGNKKVFTADDIAASPSNSNNSGNNNSTGNSKEVKWRTFYFSDQSCGLTLPNIPVKIEPGAKFSKTGAISYAYQLKTGSYIWELTILKYPSMTADQFEQEYLKQVKELKGKSVSNKVLEDKSYYNEEKILVRQLISEDAKNIYKETRLFFFRNRIFNLTITTANYKDNSSLINDLFSSVHILSGESNDNSAVKLIETEAAVIRGEVINRVSPEYPEEAKLARVEGDVEVEVTIDEKGDVIKANIDSGNAVFHENALKAIKQWKFKPTLLYGIPVKVSGKITLRFKL